MSEPIYLLGILGSRALTLTLRSKDKARQGVRARQGRAVKSVGLTLMKECAVQGPSVARRRL